MNEYIYVYVEVKKSKKVNPFLAYKL